MRSLLNHRVLARLLLPLVLVPLLSLSSRVRLASRAMHQIQEALVAHVTLSLAAQAAERQPWRGDLWERAADAALEAGDPQATIDYLGVAAALAPLSPEGLTVMGDAYQLLGQPSQALEAWQRAMFTSQASYDLYTRMARAHRQLEDDHGLIADLQAMLILQPSDPQIHYQLGLLQAVYQPDSALAYLTRAAELDPNLALTTRELEGVIRRARLVNDEPAYLQMEVGRTLAAMGEWPLAYRAFQEATRLRPDYADAWAFLAEASYQLGEVSYRELRRAHDLDPSSVAVNLLSALFWQRQGRFDYALVFLQVAAGQQPENPALQVELGMTQAAMGEFQEGMAHLQRAVELAPQEAQYWRHLAGFSLQNELQIQEVGLPAARQALLLERDDPAARDLVGQAYYLLGDQLLAKRFLLQALEADPQYPPAHLHLGLVYLAEGDLGAARQHLDRAVALGEETPAAESARQVLQYYFP